ncbi:MAG TPA: hypothetical protein PKA60_00230 [Candidatus Paceibacterota bacterium]|nr:hypothetical protein [Candidatus Paceibacterota bacterium]
MKKNKNKSSGFIHAIILLIIALVVASLFGYGPQYIWDQFLAPIFIFAWDIIVAIVNFVSNLIKKIIEISNILNWFN